MTPIELLPKIAPEFAAMEDLADYVAMAEMQVGPKLCGDKRPLLVAYLAAHTIAMSKRKGNAGQTTSLSEGGLSVGFGSHGVMGSLGQTSYGMEFDRISRACIFTARTRVQI